MGKKKYPKLVLGGNIDTHQLLTNGSEEEIKNAVMKAIDDVAEGGGYILATDTQIDDGCKFVNILTMIKTAREYGKYPGYNVKA